MNFWSINDKIDRWMDGSINGWMDVWMGALREGCRGGWVVGWVDMGGWFWLFERLDRLVYSLNDFDPRTRLPITHFKQMSLFSTNTRICVPFISYDNDNGLIMRMLLTVTLMTKMTTIATILAIKVTACGDVVVDDDDEEEEEEEEGGGRRMTYSKESERSFC